MIELGIIDIKAEVSFLALPREGHLDAAVHVMAHVGQRNNSRLVYYPFYTDIDLKKLWLVRFYWRRLYPWMYHNEVFNSNLIYRIKWIMAMAQLFTLLEFHLIQLNYWYQIGIMIVQLLIDLRTLIKISHATSIERSHFGCAFSPPGNSDMFLYSM